jgi:hypothetical protein
MNFKEFRGISTNFKKPQRISTIRESGFTALYAVLIASLALAIALAVANIALKESLLSSAARESQFAFYAANSGIECARYWDKQGKFVDPISDITCNNLSVTVMNLGSDPFCNPCTFNINLSPYSATVEISKEEIVPGTGIYRTLLLSRGYNTSNLNNPRRVERGLGVIYR